MKRLATFIPLALLWLPFGMLVLTVARGFSPSPEPRMLTSLIVLAPFGLPLALACWMLRREGYDISAWIAFAVLAPMTVVAVLFAGLLGYLSTAISSIVFSLPAWAVYAFFRYRSKSRPA